MTSTAWRKGRKTLPRTLTHDVTGSCGHPYKRRDLVDGELQEIPLTDAVWMLVDENLAKKSEKYAHHLCPDCFSAQELEAGRRRMEDFSRAFGKKPLPQLDGSLRQVAYAESVREDIWWRYVNRRYRAIHSALTEATVAEELLTVAVQVLAEKHHVVAGRLVPSEDILMLQRQVTKGSYSIAMSPLSSRSTPQECLAFWLLMRKEWTAEWRFYDEHRPKIWVASKINRHQYPLPDPDSHMVATAIFVSRLTHWESRDAAEQAFGILSAYKDSITTIMSLLTNNVDSTWEQLFEDAAIWNILQAGNKDTEMPF